MRGPAGSQLVETFSGLCRVRVKGRLCFLPAHTLTPHSSSSCCQIFREALGVLISGRTLGDWSLNCKSRLCRHRALGAASEALYRLGFQADEWELEEPEGLDWPVPGGEKALSQNLLNSKVFGATGDLC